MAIDFMVSTSRAVLKVTITSQSIDYTLSDCRN
jgi:hypothetical protein